MSSSLIEKEITDKTKNLKEIKRIIEAHKLTLEKKYQVKNIEVFGSYARGEQNKTGDLDVLVEFDRRIGFFKFLELEEYLQQVLHIKVDPVSKSGRRHAARARHTDRCAGVSLF